MQNPTELQACQARILHYSERIQQCRDVIKQLQGFTPENFTFTFTIKEKPVVTFEIEESEGNFCVSFFMCWHQYYNNQLNNQKKLLAILREPLGATG